MDLFLYDDDDGGDDACDHVFHGRDHDYDGGGVLNDFVFYGFFFLVSQDHQNFQKSFLNFHIL